uniref:Zinc finger CCHC-type and RNA-binding motif-containing protein 1 n=2 Tax=Lygus hesperus TaxID=30085 RepID=A0A0A9ZIR1_LYGHE
MSGGIAPSRSTVYTSNLAYSLTNNDLHKIFSKYGQVVKVTLVKDKQTRKSKGVAFVQYLRKENAQECVRVLNGKQMFDRTIKCSIARDNGRSVEFIRKRYYPDKSSCYECGEEGHLSYECPKNSLGRRTPPPKKEKKKPRIEKHYDVDELEEEENSDEVPEEPDLETLSAAIQMEQAKMNTGADLNSVSNAKKKVIKKNTYFSDEEDLSD